MRLSARLKRKIFFRKLERFVLNNPTLMKIKDRILEIFLIILTIIVFLVMGVSLIKSFGDPSKYFSPLILSSAALIAIFTYFREREKIYNERKQLKSEFFFTQATKGLDEVLNLLKDKKNQRVIWIRAARSLLEALQLSKEIETKEFQRAYRLYEQRVRNDLYLALTIYDPRKGNRQPLPPGFFYGAKDWKENKPLDQLATEVSAPIKAHESTLQHMSPDPQLHPLGQESVCAIFDFLDYPNDYDDPLSNVHIWDKDWTSVFGVKLGAAMYIAHRSRFFAIDGKLHERTPDENPNGKY